MSTNSNRNYTWSTIIAALCATGSGIISLFRDEAVQGVLWFLLAAAWFIADDIAGIRKTLATKQYTVNLTNNGGSIRAEDVVKAIREMERKA